MTQGSWLRRPFPYRFYNATVALIVINVAFFFFSILFPRFLYGLALIPAQVVLGNEWWRLLTYMFAHGGTWHLLLNKLALLMFGLPLEHGLGSSEYLLYYLVTGLLAGLATLAVNWFTGLAAIPVVGASGAIFAVLLGYATLYPETRILLFWFIPMRAPTAVLVFAGLELVNMLRTPRSGVAHLTHLAGLGFGLVYFLLRLDRNPLRVFFRRRW